MQDEKFIYGGFDRTHFSNGKEINDKFLDYVAGVALESIIKELPEQIRTTEVVNEIITVHMKKSLRNCRIVLS